jgi:hypothetical protein
MVSKILYMAPILLDCKENLRAPLTFKWPTPPSIDCCPIPCDVDATDAGAIITPILEFETGLTDCWRQSDATSRSKCAGNIIKEAPRVNAAALGIENLGPTETRKIDCPSNAEHAILNSDGQKKWEYAHC